MPKENTAPCNNAVIARDEAPWQSPILPRGGNDINSFSWGRHGGDKEF